MINEIQTKENFKTLFNVPLYRTFLESSPFYGVDCTGVECAGVVPGCTHVDW